MIDGSPSRNLSPRWVSVVATLGAIWNAFGLVQLADFARRTPSSLMTRGMSAQTAELYYRLPDWMTLAFAVGSMGGLVGGLLLLTRRRAAKAVLAASLIGYLALFLGDLAYGVFDAMPGQMAVLSLVLAIAVGMLGAGLLAWKRGRAGGGS